MIVLLAMRTSPPPIAGEACFQKPARSELLYSACHSSGRGQVRVSGLRASVGVKVGMGVGASVAMHARSFTSGLNTYPSLQTHSYVKGFTKPSSTQSIVSLSQPWSPSVHIRGVGMCVGACEGAKVGATVGTSVGVAVSHAPAVHTPLAQSVL